MKRTTPRPQRAKMACLLLALAALVLPATGCNVLTMVGLVGEAIVPPTEPAQYVPPKTAPMLVLVENRQNPGRAWAESEQLAALISSDLTTHKVCPVIPQDKLIDLRDKDPLAMRQMSITAIGKAVEAQQVLYVDVLSINTPTITGTPSAGRVEMRVHVIDVATGKTAWPVAPNEPTAMSFEAKAPLSLEEDRIVVFNETLLRGAGHSVARLFYEYDPAADAQ